MAMPKNLDHFSITALGTTTETLGTTTETEIELLKCDYNITTRINYLHKNGGPGC